MYQTSAILTLQSDSQTAVNHAVQRLVLAGFEVIRSFDLKVAMAEHLGCTCPHHGTDQCDCQMVVLLVYGQSGSPVTLVVHGHDGQTQVALMGSAEQELSASVVKRIVRALLSAGEHWVRARPGIEVEDGQNGG